MVASCLIVATVVQKPGSVSRKNSGTGLTAAHKGLRICSSNPVLTHTTNTPTRFPSGRHAAGCEQPRCSLLPHPSPLLGRERLVPGAVSALISAPRRSATEQLLCPQTSQPRAVEEPRGEAAPARGGRGAQGSILQDSYQSKHGEQDGCHYIHVREYKSIIHS